MDAGGGGGEVSPAFPTLASSILDAVGVEKGCSGSDA